MTLAIDGLSALEAVARPKVEPLTGVRDKAPVHEVPRMQYREARHGVHRGTRHVEVVANPNEVGIGELIVEQRIAEGAVTVVRGPREIRRARRYNEHRKQEDQAGFHD